MGCIEIFYFRRWIEWDTAINRNMGCIEIHNQSKVANPRLQINRNMGCIEISASVGAICIWIG